MFMFIHYYLSHTYLIYNQILSSSDGILTTDVVPARITKVLFVDGTEIGESPVPQLIVGVTIIPLYPGRIVSRRECKIESLFTRKHASSFSFTTKKCTTFCRGDVIFGILFHDAKLFNARRVAIFELFTTHNSTIPRRERRFLLLPNDFGL